jgi:mRNA interferase RelE/StbE
MKVEYLERFYKDLDNINLKNLKQNVVKVIINVKDSDKISSVKDIKKIKGSKIAYRVRIGDYRIGVYYEKDTIQFARILHRKDIYKYFPRK